MLRSLTTAATGMSAQQLNIDVISNNIANANTTGYKTVRAEFEELLSQTLRSPGAQGTQGTNQPVGIQIGLGTRTSGTEKMFSQGPLNGTDNSYDLAIQGDGFFQVQMDDGTTSYTRDGSLKVDSSGALTTSDGNIIIPQITIPSTATAVTITSSGQVSVTTAGSTTQTQVGTLQLAKFVNPSGLLSIGNNLYAETQASGTPTTSTPGLQGFGTIQQGYLEGSNVQLVTELVNLITAQRAFESNSKIITAADNMLQTVNRLG